MNAFTAKEYTCYYARVLDTDLPLAIDVVCDMVTGSLIRARGRGRRARRHPRRDRDDRGRPGRPGARRVRRRAARRHPARPPDPGHRGVDQRPDPATDRRATTSAHYTRDHLVVAAAGNLDHDTVVRLVDAGLRSRPAASGTPTAGRSPRASAATARVAHAGPRWCSNRRTEQAHLVLGMPGVARTDERRFALGVLNTVARRRHVLPAVPGGPREARPGLLGLQLHLAPRRQRHVRRLRRLPARARSTRC